MASSRSASPSSTAGGSADAFSLTPRSKIKQLLAKIDDSSDEDDRRQEKTASVTVSPLKRGRSMELAERSGSPTTADDGNDSEDEDIIRPRGRMAARMLGDTTTQPHSTKSVKQVEEDARKRVRKLLQQPEGDKKSSEKVVDEEIREARDRVEEGEEEEEEDMPVVSHRRRERKSQTPEPQAPSRAESPGMFVSPDRPQSSTPKSAGGASDSDPDLPCVPSRNERFLALVAKKRQERLAKEAEEAKKKAARLAAQEASALSGSEDDDVSDITDDEGGRKLTQETSRPAPRKSSKKALEEMNRETQRISRNQQLAHQAMTKKKITKASLFERFNFRPEGVPGEAKEKVSSSSRPATPQTDAEMKDAETPPSSPPLLGKETMAPTLHQHLKQDAPVVVANDDEDMPTLDEALATGPKIDKGKGVATDMDELQEEHIKPVKTRRNVRVKLPVIHANRVSIDSDDELVITQTKKGRLDSVFDRVPAKQAQESRSLVALRHLAHIGSPSKESKRKNDRSSVTLGELQATLQQRARQQAKLERERRVEFLKSKGIHVQTEEEREREMAEVEDIVARARKEAEEIMQREREAAKRAKKEPGEVDPLAWDSSSDDADFEDGDDQDEVELSGSEEEDDSIEAGGDEDEEDAEEESMAGVLVDDAAESGDESAEEATEEHADLEDSDEDTAVFPTHKARRGKKHVTILSDDEDEQNGHIQATPRPKTIFPKSPSAADMKSPQVPTSVLRSATKTFIPGLPIAVGGPAGLGLTQIFAGTMGDSQADPASGSLASPMPTFDNFPDSQFSQTHADDMIMNSQPHDSENASIERRDSQSQGIQIDFNPTQTHSLDSLIRAEEYSTQASEMIDPTQDGGYQNYTPLKERFVEPPVSTAETMVIAASQVEEPQDSSPLLNRKGRLVRKVPLHNSESDEEDLPAQDLEEDEFGFGTTAFGVMKEAAIKEKRRRAKELFDKKKSKAREMIEEQAEESEDEYAGLGGADGDDSDDDDAASVQEMIDDNAAASTGDDAKLAAFYAERERANDEKQVDKLFRDITSGMLRKKRGADYDLSDSDDGGEARRRMKRRQFAKMQKALFADERISKVAENPRNSAFLRTIEDRESDDEMDFVLTGPDALAETQESTEDEQVGRQGHVQSIPNSQPVGEERVTSHGQSADHTRNQGGHMANPRRSKGGKKPSSLSEIRDTLSNLLEEPNNSVIPATEVGSDSDGSDKEGGSHGVQSPNKENRNPRRRAAAAVSIVDRISLKRKFSSNLSDGTAAAGANNSRGAAGRLAFAAPASSAGGFKVPALLRRATTNSLISNGSSTSSGTGTSASLSTAGPSMSLADDAGKKIKTTASKRSGINYFARENERRAAIAEGEKRREAKKWKGAEGRGKMVGGLFGAGQFE